jgi:hypothetical protein
LQDYISSRNLYLNLVEGCTKSAEQFSNYSKEKLYFFNFYNFNHFIKKEFLNGELENLFYCFNHLIPLAYGAYLFTPTGKLN